MRSSSTVLYHPWMASLLVALGFMAAVASFSFAKKESPLSSLSHSS